MANSSHLMPLKTVFQTDGAGQVGLTNILDNARQKLIAEFNTKKTKKETSALEDQLNEIFYPENETQFSRDYGRAVAEATKQDIIETFANFNIEDNKGNGEGSSKGKKGKQYSNTQRIKQSNFQNSVMEAEKIMKHLKNQIELLPENDQNRIEVEKKLLKVKEYVSKGNAILRDFYKGNNRTAQFIKLSNTDTETDTNKVIETINNLNSFITTAKGMKDPGAAGKVFEKALASINFYEKSVNQAFGEINQILAGDNQVSRHFSSRLLNVKYEIHSSLKDDESVKDVHGFTYKDENITYSYQPTAEKKGKMDVFITYDDGSGVSPFRVSAKRWGTGYGDLGETSIDAAITRSSKNLSVPEAYKFAILKPNKDRFKQNILPKFQASDIAHEFAKIALKTDIAMGLSQKKGYADVLIIDTGVRIKVINIEDVIGNLRDKEGHSLSGYDEGIIEDSALSVYRKIGSIHTKRTSSYLGIMTSTLNKMKVTINLSAKNFSNKK